MSSAPCCAHRMLLPELKSTESNFSSSASRISFFSFLLFLGGGGASISGYPQVPTSHPSLCIFFLFPWEWSSWKDLRHWSFSANRAKTLDPTSRLCGYSLSTQDAFIATARSKVHKAIMVIYRSISQGDILEVFPILTNTCSSIDNSVP